LAAQKLPRLLVRAKTLRKQVDLFLLTSVISTTHIVTFTFTKQLNNLAVILFITFRRANWLDTITSPSATCDTNHKLITEDEVHHSENEYNDRYASFAAANLLATYYSIPNTIFSRVRRQSVTMMQLVSAAVIDVRLLQITRISPSATGR